MERPSSDERTLRIEDEHESWIEELKEELNKGKWETIKGIILKNPIEAFKVKLNDNGDTLLLLAFKGEKKGLYLIEKLVDMMSSDLLAETDNFGNTALHIAANVGVVRDASKLVEKNKSLLNIFNNDGLLPIQMALSRRDLAKAYFMAHFLLKEMKDERNSALLKDAAGASVMQSLLKAGNYELALDLLQYNKNLAWEGDIRPLQQMASDPGGFGSGRRLSGWSSLIYSLKYNNYKMILSKVPANEPAQNLDVLALEPKHRHALDLVKFLCSIILTKPNSIQEEELQTPFLLGAQNGIEEIVNEILNYFPTAINYTDEEGRSVFHVAVMYRRENILKIAHEQNMKNKGMYVKKLDGHNNNILHLVGYKPCQAGIHTHHSGAIFQMQQELQWFMKVTDLVTPQESTSRNKEGKTPFTLFEEEHAEMAKNENDWMTGMATASSVAASLVATVAFSVAFQVPGGNHTNGIPNFSNEASFKVFAISDALALFSSITSVLTFLSIFTSRYGVQDYLRDLPHRVIIGLISLLLSSIFLIIAFSSTLFLVFAKQNDLFLIPIIILSCTPLILYAKLQLPSLVAMIKSTFCPSILKLWI